MIDTKENLIDFKKWLDEGYKSIPEEELEELEKRDYSYLDD